MGEENKAGTAAEALDAASERLLRHVPWRPLSERSMRPSKEAAPVQYLAWLMNAASVELEDLHRDESAAAEVLDDGGGPEQAVKRLVAGFAANKVLWKKVRYIAGFDPDDTDADAATVLGRMRDAMVAWWEQQEQKRRKAAVAQNTEQVAAPVAEQRAEPVAMRVEVQVKEQTPAADPEFVPQDLVLQLSTDMDVLVQANNQLEKAKVAVQQARERHTKTMRQIEERLGTPQR